MRFFKRPIVWVVIVFIGFAACYWDFYVRPVGQALFRTAQREYDDGNFKASLDLARKAQRYDPISFSVFNLIAWNFLKLRNLPEAEKYFRRALILDSHSVEARLGLAYTYLEMKKPDTAIENFGRLPASDRHAPEVRIATARAFLSKGQNAQAMEIVRGVIEEYPSNSLAIRQLAELTGAEDLATLEQVPPPGKKPADLVVEARLRDGFFEVPMGQTWKKLYIAGVNIGPATPGHFATEPPANLQTYYDWFSRIAGMGANTVRVYTLLPPGFYRALYMYNAAHPDFPLYLFQEIWLKEPLNDNLFDPAFTDDFGKTVRGMVDALHGRNSLPVEGWEAGGIYSVDVSRYVAAWLVGREIEPHIAITTNLRNPGVGQFKGTYLSIQGGNPTEIWLTQRCDELVHYEVEQYNCQRPVAFVNWPPLDPLHHPTEARLVDELRIRTKLGEKLKPLGPGVQDDTDVVSLDEEKVRAQPAFQAGYFALFHVYPFWPDFIFLDPQYRTAQDPQGLSNYWGYIEALKEHYKRTPLVVGEYGLSTSLGIAHFNPMGLNHGGLNESEQGRGLVRLTENIRQAGFAGGLVFEWIDEWWKHNWIAIDFEKPFERTALWHNEMDPEQFFGLMKFVPRNPMVSRNLTEGKPYAGGTPSDGPPPVRWITAQSDPSALYIDFALDVPPQTDLDWSKGGYALALNTCGTPCGAGSLPAMSGLHLRQGANFLVRLTNGGAGELLIADNYNPYREVPVDNVPRLTDINITPGMSISFDPNGKFEDLIVETNRRRYGPDGTYFPPERYSRSILRYGNFDRTAPDFDSLGQWYYDRGTARIRLRLAWGLLLVLDPSQGFIFNGTDDSSQPVGKISDGIQVSLISFKGGGSPNQEVATQILAKDLSNGQIAEGWSMPWPTWSTVDAQAVPKNSVGILAAEFSKLTGYPTVERGQ
jgi:tetratricopeptide (TPR) repeat protein